MPVILLRALYRGFVKFLLIRVLSLPLHPWSDSESDLFGIALGVEGQQAGEDLVADAEFRRLNKRSRWVAA